MLTLNEALKYAGLPQKLDEADQQFSSRAEWLKAAKALGKITIRQQSTSGGDIEQAVVGDAENRGKGASIGEWDKTKGTGFLFAIAAKRAANYNK